ncbi:MAG: EMC3/TMCO1 family protein [archaeon]
MALEGFFNTVFGPIMKIGYPINIIIITLIITLIVTLIYKYTTNQTKMKELKDGIKAAQGEIKQNKDNPGKMMEIQKKAMEQNLTYMKHSLIPMLITFVPLIIMFGWLRGYFTEIGNPKFLGLTWIWVYLISSIIMSIGIRKIMKVY